MEKLKRCPSISHSALDSRAKQLDISDKLYMKKLSVIVEPMEDICHQGRGPKK